MHAKELIEFGALLAYHGPVLVQHTGRINRCAVDEYWTASRCRQDRWNRMLGHLAEQKPAAEAETERESNWHAARPVLEEIVTGELLTRIWAALSSAIDGRQGTNEIGPIGQSVLVGQLEARRRTLDLLVNSQALSLEGVVTLNRLRRQVERWTDLLLGTLQLDSDVRAFGFGPERIEDFAEDFRHERRATGDLAWQLLLASLRGCFLTRLADEAANADLNRRIASGVLASFRPELFDSIGSMKSLWMLRLEQMSSDTQEMLDYLVADEGPVEGRTGRF